MVELSRRRFFGFLAAPAIVRASSLMAISTIGSVSRAVEFNLLIDLETDGYITLFQKELEQSLRQVLTEHVGPLYYSNDGIDALVRAVERVPLPSQQEFDNGIRRLFFEKL